MFSYKLRRQGVPTFIERSGDLEQSLNLNTQGLLGGGSCFLSHLSM